MSLVTILGPHRYKRDHIVRISCGTVDHRKLCKVKRDGWIFDSLLFIFSVLSFVRGCLRADCLLCLLVTMIVGYAIPEILKSLPPPPLYVAGGLMTTCRYFSTRRDAALGLVATNYVTKCVTTPQMALYLLILAAISSEETQNIYFVIYYRNCSHHGVKRKLPDEC